MTATASRARSTTFKKPVMIEITRRRRRRSRRSPGCPRRATSRTKDLGHGWPSSARVRPMAHDLASMDATAQAELVATGESSPAELVDAAIARIEKVNPAINAVIHELFDRARAEAASPELPDGPFKGVPFVLKDLPCHMKGEPFHEG